jgi:hypothetical protein
VIPASPSGPRPGLDEEIGAQMTSRQALIDRAPPVSLYPLYRAMAVETNFLDSGVQLIQTTRDRFAFAVGCLGIGGSADPGADEGSQLGLDPSAGLDAAKELRNVSSVLNVVGRLLMAWGGDQVRGRVPGPRLRGGVIYKNRKKVGNLLLGVSGSLGGRADSLEAKVRYCTLRAYQERILQSQQLILSRLGRSTGGTGGSTGTPATPGTTGAPRCGAGPRAQPTARKPAGGWVWGRRRRGPAVVRIPPAGGTMFVARARTEGRGCRVTVGCAWSSGCSSRVSRRLDGDGGPAGPGTPGRRPRAPAAG